MLFQRIRIPPQINAITRNHKGANNNMVIIGIDSETKNGKPISLQFEDEIVFTTDKLAFSHFIRYIDKLPGDGSTYLLFGHNLTFDLISFFYSKRKVFLTDTFEFEQGDWTIKGLYSTGLCYVFLHHKDKHKTVYILDTFAFFKGSLKKLAELFCPDLPKLEAPKGLGTKNFNRSNKKFVKYAVQDSLIAGRVGGVIVDLFREYDIQPCVSQAQMAARIFKHKFVNEPIPLQPKSIMYSALHSYHGGKNNLTVKRGLYKNVYSIDITSAYPAAMAAFPSFTQKSLYKGIRGNKIAEPVPPEGIYKISGQAAPCKWPVLYNHAFKSISGDFKGVWTTGYELNEGLRSGELKITDLFGYYYDTEKDHYESAWKNYVDHFFDLKEKATDPVHRYFAKIMLNALYGKTIQKNKPVNQLMYDYDLDTKAVTTEALDFVAGGLFNPFIASLITGHTRATIHALEHKYKALHTSTDGIIAEKPPIEVKGLGGIKLECAGDAYIFRNKVYILYNDTVNNMPSAIYPGKYIQKYAHHGFHAKIEVLEKMIISGVYDYDYIHVNKLKESMKRGLQVNEFVTNKARLKLDNK